MNVIFHKNRGARGYVLLVLLLCVSLLSIGLLTMMERIDFQIKRDREEEFIHRGLEYSRAVRKYVKRFGHYPTSVEALEKSSDGRFLRKRYKDPITRRDFKILHYGDLETFNASSPLVPTTGGVAPRPATAGAQARTAASANQQPSDTGAQNSPGGDQGDKAQSNQADSNPTDPNQADPNQADPNQAAAATQPLETEDATKDGEDTSGLAVIGVTSYSKSKSIRVFNKKDHYNQWQFVYDPSTDTGLLTAPNRPLLNGAANNAPPQQSGQGSSQDSATNLGQK